MVIANYIYTLWGESVWNESWKRLTAEAENKQVLYIVTLILC